MADTRDPSGGKRPDRASLDDRLTAARKAAEGRKPRSMIERSAFGIATRLVAELVTGLVVGGLIGWVLDRVFGTTPVLLVVFFILGSAAGILNVIRAAGQMNRARMQEAEEQKDGSGKD